MRSRKSANGQMTTAQRQDTSASASERQGAEHRICEEEARDLPAEMDFDKGYNHLTKEQRVYLKKKLAPEGSFFMKGKYAKTVRTPHRRQGRASEGKWLSASERERARGCEPICGKPRCC